MGVPIVTVLVLCGLGVLSAVALHFVARRFRHDDDPRIETVEEMLPGANCGACGFAGCHALAEAFVRSDDISSLHCPIGGDETLMAVTAYLGKTGRGMGRRIAVVRCAGCYEVRPRTSIFDGARSCAVEAATHRGATGCGYGCLGHGDCVVVCAFDAIRMNPATGLPEVDEEKCTACGKCVEACPKAIIELRPKGPRGRRIFVSCVSRDRGAVALKSCRVACIGCGKCVEACAFEAIRLENNLAYIDPQKCRLCRKCAPVCPTGAILEINFPKPVNGGKNEQI